MSDRNRSSINSNFRVIAELLLPSHYPLEVASSRMRIGGFFKTARAIATAAVAHQIISDRFPQSFHSLGELHEVVGFSNLSRCDHPGAAENPVGNILRHSAMK